VPSVDTSGRLNLPTAPSAETKARAPARHLSQADVVLGLEMTDYWGTINAYRDQLHRTSKPITKPNAKIISLGCGDLYGKSNYQDQQRFADVDVAMTGDGEATLPMLIEAVRKHTDQGRKSSLEARGKKHAEAHKADFEKARVDATYGWDASPVSTGRLCAEVYEQIRNEDWSLASPTASLSYWPQRLWTMDKPYHFIGDGGGMGIGYCASASVGAHSPIASTGASRWRSRTTAIF
jgi:acetolactate synthase-1/2/3 large subunit